MKVVGALALLYVFCGLVYGMFMVIDDFSEIKLKDALELLMLSLMIWPLVASRK